VAQRVPGEPNCRELNAHFPVAREKSGQEHFLAVTAAVQDDSNSQAQHHQPVPFPMKQALELAEGPGLPQGKIGESGFLAH